MTVFAIPRPNFLRRRYYGGPDGRGGTLRHALEFKRRLALGCELSVNRLDERGVMFFAHVTPEFSADSTRMHGGSPDAAGSMPAVKFDCKEDIGCLGPPICYERLIGRTLKAGVIKVDIREPMA
jgi:hypothetical protein